MMDMMAIAWYVVTRALMDVMASTTVRNYSGYDGYDGRNPGNY